MWLVPPPTCARARPRTDQPTTPGGIPRWPDTRPSCPGDGCGPRLSTPGRDQSSLRRVPLGASSSPSQAHSRRGHRCRSQSRSASGHPHSPLGVAAPERGHDQARNPSDHPHSDHPRSRSRFERARARATGERGLRNPASRSSLLRIVERHARRPGVGALRALLDARGGPARTRSPAEERLLMLLRAAGLPEPEVNARLEPWEVDFLWREERLVVEVDGYASHSSPEAFERDRRKTAELQDAGFLVHRVTAKAVQGDPGSAVATIGRMVDRARVRLGQ
ncbi:MAG TPA: DUF559 domain-containing protein [Solirubrobacterales bacterium]|nr:DUF559 domain-containing protein [Solirubrobacterales bacterium]